MTAWENEKAYNAKRAQELGAALDEARAANDRDKFETTYQTAMRYMTVKQRKPYYIRFLRRNAQ